jgi:hypothetical protein
MTKRLVMVCLFFVAGTSGYAVAQRGGGGGGRHSDGETNERSTTSYAARDAER